MPRISWPSINVQCTDIPYAVKFTLAELQLTHSLTFFPHICHPPPSPSPPLPPLDKEISEYFSLTPPHHGRISFANWWDAFSKLLWVRLGQLLQVVSTTESPPLAAQNSNRCLVVDLEFAESFGQLARRGDVHGITLIRSINFDHHNIPTGFGLYQCSRTPNERLEQSGNMSLRSVKEAGRRTEDHCRVCGRAFLSGFPHGGF